MITIRIGESERFLNQIDEQWVNQQVHRRRSKGDPVCAQVIVEKEQVNMILATSECISNGYSDRKPNSNEQRIFEIWNKLGLKKPDFTGDNLIAFLKQLEELL